MTDVSNQCAPVSDGDRRRDDLSQELALPSWRGQDLRQLEQRATLTGADELQPLGDCHPTDGYRAAEEGSDGDQPIAVTHREHEPIVRLGEELVPGLDPFRRAERIRHPLLRVEQGIPGRTLRPAQLRERRQLDPEPRWA